MRAFGYVYFAFGGELAVCPFVCVRILKTIISRCCRRYRRAVGMWWWCCCCCCCSCCCCYCYFSVFVMLLPLLILFAFFALLCSALLFLPACMRRFERCTCVLLQPFMNTMAGLLPSYGALFFSFIFELAKNS